MNAKKVVNTTYRSRSAAAIAIISNGTSLTNSEIAKTVGMTPQTVSAAFAIETKKAWGIPELNPAN